MKTKKTRELKAWGIVDLNGLPVMDAKVDHEPIPTVMMSRVALKRHTQWISIAQDDRCKVVPVTITYPISTKPKKS